MLGENNSVSPLLECVEVRGEEALKDRQKLCWRAEPAAADGLGFTPGPLLLLCFLLNFRKGVLPPEVLAPEAGPQVFRLLVFFWTRGDAISLGVLKGKVFLAEKPADVNRLCSRATFSSSA